GLAVDAVRRVDPKARAAGAIANDLVDARRAVALCRLVELGHVPFDRHRRVRELQVARLILVMPYAREIDRRQSIERDLAVRARVADARRGPGRDETRVIGHRVAQRPRHAAAQHVVLEEGERGARKPAEARETGAEVARGAKLVPQPRPAYPLREAFEHAAAVVAGSERVVHGLGREHPALHRRMNALEPRAVQEAGIAADEHAARKREPWQRCEPALDQGARAVADAPAAAQHRLDRGMALEALELVERRQMRISIAERDDEPDRDETAGRVIQETAAVGIVGQRPADRVQHLARTMPGRIDLPQLLEAEAVVLRVAKGPQVEAPLERTRELAAAAFGEDHV